VLKDIQYAFRSLLHQLTFSLVTVITLALGIGGVNAMDQTSEKITTSVNGDVDPTLPRCGSDCVGRGTSLQRQNPDTKPR
jgi:hypothetical protein